jgi:CrcB protein
MSVLAWIGVAVAGAVGAPARYLLDGYVQDRTRGDLPWGTFVVNVTGSLVLGVVTGLALGGHLGDLGKDVAGTGLCGAFTTFSTFTLEATRLAEEGRWAEAGWVVGASIVVGLAAAALGLGLATLA